MIAVVTDSGHYLPRELADRLGLHQVSIYVNWNGKTEREIDMNEFGPFYDYLRSGGRLPTTAQPSVGDFLAVYEPLLAQGFDIFSAHIAGSVSGTVQAARQARQQLVDSGVDHDRISVFDSNSVCAGLAFILIGAVRAAADGATLAETVEAARALRESVNVWFAVETLEFLRRGGRIGAAQAWIGSALRIKPILAFESEVVPVERVRTSKRATERLCDYLSDSRKKGRTAWIVQHVQASEQADALAQRGREIVGSEPEFVSEIGPVTGTHGGPGLLGVSTAALPAAAF